MNIFWTNSRRGSLCYTCVNAFIVRGFNEREERVYCDFCMPERLVPFPVRDCSGYFARTAATEGATPANAGKPAPGFVRRVGFVQPGPNGEEPEQR